MKSSSKLNHAKSNRVWRRPARRGHALFILVLVLGSLVGRTEIYAVNVTDTFYGIGALAHVTTGVRDSAFGYNALNQDTSGNANTAIGGYALFSNHTGSFNTASGDLALTSNTTGDSNTASGDGALAENTTGDNNTASGDFALFSNTTGDSNTASGSSALLYNITGNFNTASGANALYYNATGIHNTADGAGALYFNTTGASNVGIGFNAGRALTTGSGNVCIGQGVLGVAGESNTTRIRNVYASIASGRAVYVTAGNKIGTLVSSRRFKQEIKPMEKASEAILALRPVSFRYKKEIEDNGAKMFGLIAEEVEKVDPELVTRNEKGEAETVRYDAVNVMLLNEFLKEHRKVEQMQKQIEALTAGLQKVSAQLELNKAATQTVLIDQ
jgi:Chaperone of endosialidase